MANSIFLEQERSIYETPKIDVVQITAQDVVRTSPEGGDEWNGGWI